MAKTFDDILSQLFFVCANSAYENAFNFQVPFQHNKILPIPLDIGELLSHVDIVFLWESWNYNSVFDYRLTIGINALLGQSQRLKQRGM